MVSDVETPLWENSRRIAGIAEKIEDVTGVILAGGASRRMGRNKALLMLHGVTLIERAYRSLSRIFHDIVIITNTPEKYAFIPCRTASDIYPEAGAIAGLHAGMTASNSSRIFVAACDMPFLNEELIRMLCNYDKEADAVVPINGEGFFEPLHAVYSVSARETAREVIESGNNSILVLLGKLRAVPVSFGQVRSIPDAENSFRNLNTPEEFMAALRRV